MTNKKEIDRRTRELLREWAGDKPKFHDITQEWNDYHVRREDGSLPPKFTFMDYLGLRGHGYFPESPTPPVKDNIIPFPTNNKKGEE